MKITKNELKEIIREEAIKFKRKIELENELSEVQSQLDEVTGGPGTHETNAGVMYDKNEKTKGGALVEDGESCEEEVVAEDEIEINVGDDVPQESYLSEEALEEMLSEIMSEDDDDDDGEPVEEPVDEEPVDEEVVAEEVVAEEGACEEEVVAESKEEEKEVISEEVKRMRELAGIKIL